MLIETCSHWRLYCEHIEWLEDRLNSSLERKDINASGLKVIDWSGLAWWPTLICQWSRQDDTKASNDHPMPMARVDNAIVVESRRKNVVMPKAPSYKCSSVCTMTALSRLIFRSQRASRCARVGSGKSNQCCVCGEEEVYAVSNWKVAKGALWWFVECLHATAKPFAAEAYGEQKGIGDETRPSISMFYNISGPTNLTFEILTSWFAQGQFADKPGRCYTYF
jgi:hypothetical protein